MSENNNSDILAKNKKKFQDVIMSKNELKLNSNNSDALKCHIECKICRHLEKDSIVNHLKEIHGISYGEYRKRFPPRDFWLIQGKEDLIHIDVPEQEKELKHKLAILRDSVNQRLDLLSLQQILNQVVANHPSASQTFVQRLFFQGEFHWEKQPVKVIDLLKATYLQTLNTIKAYLDELLDEPNGKD